MANALSLSVRETKQQLQALLKKQPASLRGRIVMLLTIKKSERALSKIELARLVGVNPNSIQSWRTLYVSKGINGLLTHNKGGKRREVITPGVHKAIEKRLRSPENAFGSFKELQQWVEEHYIKGIKYVTLNAYVKRHFGAKLKVARKSHINKSEQAITAFKKNSASDQRTGSKK